MQEDNKRASLRGAGGFGFSARPLSSPDSKAAGWHRRRFGCEGTRLLRKDRSVSCEVLSEVPFRGSDKLDAEAERDGKREAGLRAPSLAQRDASALESWF